MSMHTPGEPPDFNVESMGQVRDTLTQESREKNLREAKRFITQGLLAKWSDDAAGTGNNADSIRGFRQGTNQCFAACITAWASMQGLTGQTARELNASLQQIDRAVGNTGEGVTSRSIYPAINALIQDPDERERVRSMIIGYDVSSEFNSSREIEWGGDIATHLQTGGTLILQYTNHFRLAFVDQNGKLQIYNPIGGSVEEIRPQNLMDYARPASLGASKASVLFLPNVEQPDIEIHGVTEDDFFVHS